MDKHDLDECDFELIEFARGEFDKKTAHDWHGVACALRLKSGKIFTGMVLEAEVASLAVCAEPITIGKAVHDLPDDPADCIVAVRRKKDNPFGIIPPCGRCREMITDYCPQAQVILYDTVQERPIKVDGFDLLPFKYRKSK